MDPIIDCLVSIGLSGEVAEMIVREFQAKEISFTWDTFYKHLSDWCDRRLKSVSAPDLMDLKAVCIRFGLRENLADHFVATGLIQKPEWIKTHIILAFLKKSKDGGLRDTG